MRPQWGLQEREGLISPSVPLFGGPFAKAVPLLQELAPTAAWDGPLPLLPLSTLPFWPAFPLHQSRAFPQTLLPLLDSSSFPTCLSISQACMVRHGVARWPHPQAHLSHGKRPSPFDTSVPGPAAVPACSASLLSPAVPGPVVAFLAFQAGVTGGRSWGTRRVAAAMLWQLGPSSLPAVSWVVSSPQLSPLRILLAASSLAVKAALAPGVLQVSPMGVGGRGSRIGPPGTPPGAPGPFGRPARSPGPRPTPDTAIFSRGTDQLKISCNYGRIPGPTWRWQP